MDDAAKIAAYRLARQRRVDKATADHAALTATLTGTLRVIADLHAPDDDGDCAGCDFTGHLGDSGPPEWPCRTIDAIRAARSE